MLPILGNIQDAVKSVLSSRVNWLDALIMTVVLFSVINGVRRGLVNQVLLFISSLLGIKLALDNCILLEDSLSSFFLGFRPLRLILSFIMIYFTVILACRVILGLWRKLTEDTAISWLDSVGGGVVAGLRTLIVSAICLQLMSQVSLGGLSEAAKGSYLRKMTSPVIQGIWQAIPQITDSLISKPLDSGTDLKATNTISDMVTDLEV